MRDFSLFFLKGCMIWRKKKYIPPPPPYGREGGLTNERPWSCHVIWGPMRGLKKCDPMGKHTNRNTNRGTWRVGENRKSGTNKSKDTVKPLLCPNMVYFSPKNKVNAHTLSLVLWLIIVQLRLKSSLIVCFLNSYLRLKPLSLENTWNLDLHENLVFVGQCSTKTSVL